MPDDKRRSLTEWIAGGAAATCVAVGMYAGNLTAKAENHVTKDEFARVEQKVEDTADDVREIKQEIKDINADQREVLRLLRESLAQ